MIDKNEHGTLFPFYEEIKAAGQRWVEGLNSLIREGNNRRLAVKESNGRTLLEVPLMLGLVTGAGVAFFAPFLAALGVIAAWVAQVQVVVEGYEDPVYAVVETTKTARAAATEFEGRKTL
jgi:uncharacterized membrane protein